MPEKSPNPLPEGQRGDASGESDDPSVVPSWHGSEGAEAQPEGAATTGALLGALAGTPAGPAGAVGGAVVGGAVGAAAADAAGISDEESRGEPDLDSQQQELDPEERS